MSLRVLALTGPVVLYAVRAQRCCSNQPCQYQANLAVVIVGAPVDWPVPWLTEKLDVQYEYLPGRNPSVMYESSTAL